MAPLPPPLVGNRAARLRRRRTPRTRSDRRAPCLHANAGLGPATATDLAGSPRSPGRRPPSCGCPAGRQGSHTPPRTGTAASPSRSSAPLPRLARASGMSSSSVCRTTGSMPCPGSGRTPAGTSPGQRGRRPTACTRRPGRPRSASSPALPACVAPHERTIVDMQLTHFGHSCVLADFGHTSLLFDPGNFSHGFEGITGLSAIVVTHQHPDHVDAARLPALLDANPDAALYADSQTAAQRDVPCQRVHGGDDLSVGDLTIRALGGQHAVIHPEIAVIINISYLVGDGEHPARFMHPGDALFVPDEPIDVLATPAAAPWMKVSEAVDYLRAVAPARAVPIHQAVVAPEARGIYYGRLSEMTSADFQVLPEETAVTF